jgi:hypothetical protein
MQIKGFIVLQIKLYVGNRNLGILNRNLSIWNRNLSVGNRNLSVGNRNLSIGSLLDKKVKRWIVIFWQ